MTFLGRENPRRLFECWCEVVSPKGRDRQAWIIQKFPNNYSNEEILKCVPEFAFPCSFERWVHEELVFCHEKTPPDFRLTLMISCFISFFFFFTSM